MKKYYMKKREFQKYREIKNIISSDGSTSTDSETKYGSIEYANFKTYKMTDSNRLHSLMNVISNLQSRKFDKCKISKNE